MPKKTLNLDTFYSSYTNDIRTDDYSYTDHISNQEARKGYQVNILDHFDRAEVLIYCLSEYVASIERNEGKRSILTSSRLFSEAGNYHGGTHHGSVLKIEIPMYAQNALQCPEI